MLLSIPISPLSAAKRLPFHSRKFPPSEPRLTPLPTRRSFPFPFSAERRGLGFSCFYNPNDNFETPPPTKWPVLERWEVPWPWQTFVLTNIACALSFVLVGFAESSVLSRLGFQNGDLTLDSNAEILFLNQFIATAAILGVLFGITNTFQPLPNDVLHYDLKGPFKLKDGWLLWAGIGLLGATVSIVLAGSALTLVNGENPTRETDALIRLLPLVGSSNVSTACLLGITGVLAPVLEETVFRGFLMVTLTKWLPTPVSVLFSAALFSVAHLTPGEFPQLFVLGTALGFSYAQTRNLLTPITIHALWNSSVIILLTFLQLQGYDIRELLQGS